MWSIPGKELTCAQHPLNTDVQIRIFRMEWWIDLFTAQLCIIFGCCSETNSLLQTLVDTDLYDRDVEYQLCVL